MKIDMGGCAAVIGCAEVIGQLKPQVYNSSIIFSACSIFHKIECHMLPHNSILILNAGIGYPNNLFFVCLFHL
jgi:hypothetical protein